MPRDEAARLADVHAHARPRCRAGRRSRAKSRCTRSITCGFSSTASTLRAPRGDRLQHVGAGARAQHQHARVREQVIGQRRGEVVEVRERLAPAVVADERARPVAVDEHAELRAAARAGALRLKPGAWRNGTCGLSTTVTRPSGLERSATMRAPPICSVWLSSLYSDGREARPVRRERTKASASAAPQQRSPDRARPPAQPQRGDRGRGEAQRAERNLQRVHRRQREQRAEHRQAAGAGAEDVEAVDAVRLAPKRVNVRHSAVAAQKNGTNSSA